MGLDANSIQLLLLLLERSSCSSSCLNPNSLQQQLNDDDDRYAEYSEQLPGLNTCPLKSNHNFHVVGMKKSVARK